MYREMKKGWWSHQLSKYDVKYQNTYKAKYLIQNRQQFFGAKWPQYESIRIPKLCFFMITMQWFLLQNHNNGHSRPVLLTWN